MSQLVYPTDLPVRRRRRYRLEADVVFSGLLFGLSALIGAALLLCILNGNGRRWAKSAAEQEEVLDEATFRPEGLVIRRVMTPVKSDAEAAQQLSAQSK